MKRRTPHRRNRRRSSRHNRNHGLIWKIAGPITVPVIAISGIVWALNAHMSEIAMNPDTYCYPQKNQYQMAFFVDFSVTDDNTDKQNRDLENSMKKAYEELPANGRIAFFSTDNSAVSQIAEPVLVQCRPAETPEEQENIPAPAKTAPYLKRQADEAYKKYRNAAKQLMADAKDQSKIAENSPILEQIKAISHFYQTGNLNRFKLYTDGIQTSMVRQFCQTKGHLPSFHKFKTTKDYVNLKPAPLNNVEIDLLMAIQYQYPTTESPYCTNQEILNFWDEFFKEQGASVNLFPLYRGDGYASKQRSAEQFLSADASISTEPPVKIKGPLKMGIRWPCRCDIDLYARGNKDAPFLYFAKKESAEGMYHEDFTSSPDTTGSLEYIEFTKPVNLYQIQAMVNHYSGEDTNGPSGIVRIYFDNQTYEAPFHLRSKKGNSGKSRSQAHSSIFWQVLNIPAIMGLPEIDKKSFS